MEQKDRTWVMSHTLHIAYPGLITFFDQFPKQHWV